MTHTITDLTIQQKNPGQVDIYLDHRYGFTVDLIEAAPLKRGQRLDTQTVHRYKTISTHRQAYRCALRYLSHRPHSRQEIERKLHHKGFGSPAVAEVLERLSAQGYLNDPRLAERWVENRIRSKPRSKSILRIELRKKGIDDLTIERVLTDIDDNELARRLVEKRLPRWRGLPPPAFRNKALRCLQQRGFGLAASLDAYRYGCDLLATPADPSAESPVIE